jgi:hypothetical protein
MNGMHHGQAKPEPEVASGPVDLERLNASLRLP